MKPWIENFIGCILAIVLGIAFLIAFGIFQCVVTVVMWAMFPFRKKTQDEHVAEIMDRKL